MGLFSGLMGNASEMDMEKLEKELAEILIKGEEIEQGYQLIRDYFVFTNKRLILVDKQGLTGAKKELHSIPYSSIRHFSIETARSFDRDSELKIWIASLQQPVIKEFSKKSSDILEVQKTLSKHALK
ncbi:PH domain-containing protein [Acetohalobium arabaticum]|uniref:Bacterial Pleckstrin homology domain-containing protein n=1 Tax=Acetohalobium arabaticum (strain ATCC 49924 / DSM 5501 / Z-7288) TaxID=574087 RepID=D9QVV1_ACEAZ|nr:PH domain-containing protein [Acetohalobium arabaticum]ADL12360.1 protein of unknown function DUF1696 [Acetohalobium arabaticum DSM 5501]